MSHFKRLLSTILLTTLVIGVAGSALLAPRPARAIPVEDIPAAAWRAVKDVGKYIGDILVTTGTIAIINGVDYFTRKVAYDTAVWVAAGGKGQGALFESRNLGDYLQDTALDAAGDAIGTLTEKGFLGFNLCDPTGPGAPRFRISLLLGIARSEAPHPPRPRCEWSQVSANWSEFASSVSSGEALRQASFAIEPGQSELSVAFQTNLKIKELKERETDINKTLAQIGRGFKPVVEKITGRVKTPATVVEETLQQKLVKNPDASEAEKRKYLVDALEKGAGQILPAAMGTFLNTLSSQLLNKVFEKGLFSGKDLACAGLENFNKAARGINADSLQVGTLGACKAKDLGQEDLALRVGESEARLAFADLVTPQVQEANQYDALTEFTVCPGDVRSVSNCVMDSQFAAGVRIAQIDKPLTVQKAIDQGYLNGKWPLVSNNAVDKARNQDPYCYTTGYCYSNLVKLRKARVIPIGWEIAASKAHSGEPPVIPTLQDVVDGFNECPPADAVNPFDVMYRWCHLIDPDWILKYPATQCRALVYGPTLVTQDADIRAQTCADTPSCIEEDEQGRCVGGLGYCVREKTTWRLGGDSCPTQYATCQSFTSRTGTNLALLTNTSDALSCTQANAGCRGYSIEQVAGSWQQAERVFLNKTADVCQAQDAGCRELYPKTARRNLILNSGFERDADNDNRPDHWDGPLIWSDPAAQLATSSARAVRGDGFSQTVDVEPSTSYSFSFFARRFSESPAVSHKVTVQIAERDSGGSALSAAGLPTTCGVIAGGELALSAGPSSAARYDFASCNFTTHRAAASVTLTVVRSDEGGAPQPPWVDAFQLEEGARATAYHESAFEGAGPQHLTASPTWLGCTGDATDSASCADYAPVCRADEVGCTRYTPTNGSPPVPGIVSSEDVCPTSCVGYATYHQETSRFDLEAFTPFIPRTGRRCSVAAAGCSEFTNLSAPAAGGEAREYYSDLRACVATDDRRAAVFYTWEGSEASGFQLKEWRLVADADANPAIISPERFAASCTRDIYQRRPGDPGYNPDCREFFNAAGRASYRLYSKTIVVTAECRKYRITSVPNEPDDRVINCGVIGGVWNDETGACEFSGYPAESRACTPAENGCRLYTGGSGRNVRSVFLDDFEGGTPASAGWSAIGAGERVGALSISSESLSVGGHSLKAETGTSGARKTVTIQNGSTYFVTFWAKGRGNLTVHFSGAPADRFFARGTVALTGAWNRYELGPVLVNWTPDAAETLVVEGFADESFLDNVQMTQTASAVGIIKGSWATPAVCDATNSGVALPQAQLGCSEYRANNATVSLKSFSTLCREKSIGCTAYTDTQVSDSPSRESWNVACRLPDGPDGDSEPDRAITPTACQIDGKTVCTVGIGQSECRYHVPGVVPSAGQPADLTVVPADATRYLVPGRQYECAPEKVGCSPTGLPTSASCRLAPACSVRDGCACNVGGDQVCKVANGETACRYPLPFREPYADVVRDNLIYKDTVAQNNPRQYAQSLCTLEANGCEEWETRGGGGFSYFKDPGDRVCEYKQNVQAGGATYGGWFRKGTNEACDPDYVVAGNFYGVRRNADAEYAGFVGSCREEFAGCTEYVDPADTNPALYPDGKAYTVIKNDKIDLTKCGGKVSEKTGCVLFRDASNPVLAWNVAATNKLSGQNKFDSVDPVDCSGRDAPTVCERCFGDLSASDPDLPSSWGSVCNADADCRGFLGDDLYIQGDICKLRPTGDPGFQLNDANTVIKVRQDRSCGEWLACRGSAPVWDARANKFKDVCDSVGLCDQYAASGDSTQCSHWVVNPSPKILSEELYRSRDVSPAGREYSGYAIPGNYGAETLRQIQVKVCKYEPTKACLKDDDCKRGGEDFVAPGTCMTSFRLGRIIGSCSSGDENKTCTNRSTGQSGWCWNKLCAQAVTGDATTGAAQPLALTVAEPPDCRAYPEPNSPFPNSVAVFAADGRVQNTLPGFTSAKLCAQNHLCECSYKKGVYGNGSATRYYTRGAPPSTVARGICQGGYFDGLPCDPLASGGRELTALDGSCKPLINGAVDNTKTGECTALTRQDTFEGFEGYCLERDTAVTINGDQGQHACLTWLPTDRLAGSQDIYNSYASAGYPLGNSFLCAVPDFTKTVKVGKDKCQKVWSCGSAEEYREITEYDGGVDRVRGGKACPAGYFVVIGACKQKDSVQAQFDCHRSGGEQAPYRCVPLGSVHGVGADDDPDPGDTGKKCDPKVDPALRLIVDHGGAVGVHLPFQNDYFVDGSVHASADESEINTFKRYDDCVLSGKPYDQDYYKFENATYEASCKVAVQVSVESGNNTNKAWTDRLWNGGSYRLQTGETQSYNATCTLAAPGCAGGSPCPCEIAGVGRCLVSPGGDHCSIAVNPLAYTAKTPPSFPALTTFGQTLFRNGDPTIQVEPASIPLCRNNQNLYQLRLPLPESTQCVGGFTGVGTNNGRPYTAISIGAGDDLVLVPLCTQDVQCGDNASRTCVERVCQISGRPVDPAQSCSEDGDCWLQDCSPRGLCVTRGGGTPFSSISLDPADLAPGRIRQLFTRAYALFQWQRPNAVAESTGVYVPVSTAAGFTVRDGQDRQDSAAANGRPPKVVSLGRCDASGRCEEGLVGQISIDNASGGEIRGGGGLKAATLKFFAYADPNQMPLKQVIVDWGDGVTQGPFAGSYKNHRGWILSGESPLSRCDGTNFGTSRDACDDSAPFTYIHSYSCADIDGAHCPDGSDACWIAARGACVFTPRVQVKDNWGFCNGVCSRDVIGEHTACYDASGQERADECKQDSGPWTYFTGEILVAPR